MKLIKSEQVHQIFLLTLLFIAGAINFVGALGPELAFDALWYHLPIPQLYLARGEIYHIPGGLLYYSEMPRLIDIIYLGLLKFGGEIGTHLFNFAAGVGSAVLVYLISRHYLNRTYSLLAVCVFYLTPIVSWLSGSAYIDLSRTFLETLAFLLVLRKRFMTAGLVLGLALSTKFLALGTLGIDFLLVLVLTRNLVRGVQMALVAIFVALPWYLLAFLNTGFPLYPLGAQVIDLGSATLPPFSQPLRLLGDYWKVFLSPEDLISPVPVLLLPLIIFNLRKIKSKFGLLLIYFLISYAVWWLTPRTGGGRFILPYLTIWAPLFVGSLTLVGGRVRIVFIAAVICICVFNILYRAGATYKLKDYVLGNENRLTFECQNLDSKLGSFADCNGFFQKSISRTDLVYVSGVHNLAKINFPFVHETFYRNEQFNYVLVQNGSLEDLMIQPESSALKYTSSHSWSLVHDNELSNVKLYKMR